MDTVVVEHIVKTFINANIGIKKAYAVTNEELFDKPMAELSSHQILGSIAARLAGGYEVENIGEEITSPVLLDIQKASIEGDKLTGYVVFIDHFGSCLTNITKADAEAFGLEKGVNIKITVNGKESYSIMGTRYGDVAAGEPVSIINSMEILQLSVNKGSFASASGVKTGMMVEITK